MFKGTFVTGTQISANTNIPITTVFNTNDKINNNNGVIQILQSGLYKADANLVITGVADATNVTAQFYADGVAVAGATGSATSGGTTNLITLPLQDAFRVVSTLPNNTASLAIQCNVAVTPTGGNIIVAYER